MKRTNTKRSTWKGRPGETYDLLATSRALGPRVNVHRWTDTNTVEVRAITGDGRTPEFAVFSNEQLEAPTREAVAEAEHRALQALAKAAKGELAPMTAAQQVAVTAPPCAFECEGDPGAQCCTHNVGAHLCTRRPGHKGPHVACSGNGSHATVVWGQLRPTISVGEHVLLWDAVPGWGYQWETWRVVEVKGDRAKVEKALGDPARPKWFKHVRLRLAPHYRGPVGTRRPT